MIIAPKVDRRPVKSQWGRWKLEEGRWLVYGPTGYDIGLELCRTPTERCRWLEQIASKSWATAEDLGNLVLAFRATVGLLQ